MSNKGRNPMTSTIAEELAKTVGATKRRPGRGARYSPEVAKARQREKSRRWNAAKAATLEVMRNLHPEQWDSLMSEAQALIDLQEGPLPGDPGYVSDPPGKV